MVRSSELPDYLTNLNAMHEVEKTMTDEQQWDAYEDRMRYICRRDGTGAIFHATAAQRAEAFLRTLDLWKTNP